MSDEYFLVSRDALPSVFIKVVEAKRLLSTGAAGSAAEAARMVDISRSAFYKYKDMIMPYEDTEESRVLTIQGVLEDKPGVLSLMLTTFFDAGANILTVNQNIPADGVAYVSVSARTEHMSITIAQLFDQLKSIDGVVSVSQIGINN